MRKKKETGMAQDIGIYTHFAQAHICPRLSRHWFGKRHASTYRYHSLYSLEYVSSPGGFFPVLPLAVHPYLRGMAPSCPLLSLPTVRVPQGCGPVLPLLSTYLRGMAPSCPLLSLPTSGVWPRPAPCPRHSSHLRGVAPSCPLLSTCSPDSRRRETTSTFPAMAAWCRAV